MVHQTFLSQLNKIFEATTQNQIKSKAHLHEKYTKPKQLIHSKQNSQRH